MGIAQLYIILLESLKEVSAAIAVIPTFLNYFLEKDIEKYTELGPAAVEGLGPEQA